jgi:hypothetical protein
MRVAQIGRKAIFIGLIVAAFAGGLVAATQALGDAPVGQER